MGEVQCADYFGERSSAEEEGEGEERANGSEHSTDAEAESSDAALGREREMRVA